MIRCGCWKLIFIKSSQEGGIKLSAFSAGLKHIGIEFKGPQRESDFPSHCPQNFLCGWQRQSINLVLFLRAMVQLVYEIHNFYCISAGFNEGQALGRIQAPLVPILNPMQWTQCLTGFWHLLNSEMPWLFLHAPSVASPDWFCLILSCLSQLSWLPRVWKLYSGVTHHLIIISLHASMLKLRRNWSPLFIFALYVLFLVSLIQWQTTFIFNSSLSINLKTHFLGNSLRKMFSKPENHI